MAKLTEKMIENAFIEWCPSIGLEVLKQQAKLETGIADIVCWHQKRSAPAIVEVKKGKARASVIAQIMAYMESLRWEISLDGWLSSEWLDSNDVGGVAGYLVAEKIDDRVATFLAIACGIIFIRYWIDEQGIHFIDASRELGEYGPASLYDDPGMKRGAWITTIFDRMQKLGREWKEYQCKKDFDIRGRLGGYECRDAGEYVDLIIEWQSGTSGSDAYKTQTDWFGHG